MPNRIPLDPKLPSSFDDTPNEERSKDQLDAWWDHPYGVRQHDGRIEVRCLNGGAWDRSTHLGVADNYDAACALAEKRQAEWLRFREKPVMSLENAGIVRLVKMAQRPDEEAESIAAFDTSEAAAEFLRINYPE